MLLADGLNLRCPRSEVEHGKLYSVLVLKAECRHGYNRKDGRSTQEVILFPAANIFASGDTLFCMKGKEFSKQSLQTQRHFGGFKAMRLHQRAFLSDVQSLQ